MVGAQAEAGVPLAVYFIPALIKVKIPISAHLSVSVEAAVCFFCFLFFFIIIISFQLPDLPPFVCSQME